MIIPRPFLAQRGVETGDNLEMSLEAGRLVLAPVKSHVREGWAAASAVIAAAGEDMAWPDFANEGDADPIW